MRALLKEGELPGVYSPFEKDVKHSSEAVPLVSDLPENTGLNIIRKMKGDKLNSTDIVSDGGTWSPVLTKFCCFFAVNFLGMSQRKPNQHN